MEDQVPGLPSVEAEVLSELRTLGQIVDIMGNHQEVSSSPSTMEDVVKKKVDSPPLEKTPVQLITLPQPDYLAINIDQDHPLLLTDDGSELTTQFADSLSKEGWKVVLWSFHDSLVPIKRKSNPSDLIHVRQDSPKVESIEDQLDEIRRQHGSIGGFIHLHPQKNGENPFSKSEREIIKSVFFLASELKKDLNSDQFMSRPQFFTVTRIDGRLGLEDHQNFQESSGLSGLVKTLHWEWPNVFCRAVDLSPKLEQAKQIDLLIKEMHDPDRELVEVGLGPQDRVTISREF
jgi:hypothetical protein